MKQFCFYLLLFFLPAGLTAQQLAAVRFVTESRYDNIDAGNDENRLQGALRLLWNISLTDSWSVIGLTSTGSSYTSRWEMIRDFNNPGVKYPFTLNQRQVYLQGQWNQFRVQSGAIPSVKGVVSSTGLGANGWIDGTRMEWQTESSVFEVVAGSMNDLQNPNYLERTFILNYGEVELSHWWSKTIRSELSAEQFIEDFYVRTETRWRSNLPDGKWLELTGEVLYNTNRQTASWGLTLESDFLGWMNRNWEKTVEIWLYYNYTNPFIGKRGELADDFYSFNHSLAIELDGKLNENGTISWFQKSTLAEIPRFDAGLRLDLRTVEIKE